MEPLAVYQPKPSGWVCSSWNTFNIAVDSTKIIGVAIGSIMSLGDVFMPLISHMRANHGSRMGFDVLRPTYGKTLLFASVLISPISEYSYIGTCFREDPQVQAKMQEVSKILVDLITLGKKESHSAPFSILEANYQSIYTQLSAQLAAKDVLASSKLFLREQFPNEVRLNDDSLQIGTEETHQYLKILEKRGSAQKQIVGLWQKLLSYIH